MADTQATMLPSSPRMEADVRHATDAMQKAADTLIATTEAYRDKYKYHETFPRPPESAYKPYRPNDEDISPISPTSRRPSMDSAMVSSKDPSLYHQPSGPTAESMPPVPTARFASTYPGMSSSARPLSYAPHEAQHRQSSGSDSAAGMDVTLSKANSPVQRRRPSFGPTRSSYYRRSSMSVPKLASVTEWPTPSTSTPGVGEILDDYYMPTLPAPGHIHRSSAPRIDMMEAARRYRALHSSLYSEQQSSDDFYSSQGGETPVIMPIGNYIYVSDGSDGEASTIAPETETQYRKSIRTRPPDPVSGGPPFSLIHEVFFLLPLILAQMLIFAGLAQALVPAWSIAKSFPDKPLGNVAWYTAAYTLSTGTLVIPASRLGDLYGHKRVFVVGFAWFGLWSLLAGVAVHVQASGHAGTAFFCFCRAMQGIGPAFLIPSGHVIFEGAYSGCPSRKGFVKIALGTAAPLGFVLGAVFASLFAAHGCWQWGCYVLAAVCAALVGVSVSALPGEGQGECATRAGRQSTWQQLDVPGMVLGTGGMVLFAVAWCQAPVVGWGTPYTYFLLLIGVFFLAAFAYAEWVAEHPLLPIRGLNWTTGVVLGCTAVGWAAFGICVFYGFALLQVLREWPPLLAAAGLVPFLFTGTGASVLAWFLANRMKPHWILLGSLFGFFLGSMLFATAPVKQNYWQNSFFGILFLPFGMVMSTPAAVTLFSDGVTKDHRRIAGSLVAAVMYYSISIGLGVAGTIERNVGDGGKNIMAGFRGAQYFGLGLSLFGLCLALGFLMLSYRQSQGVAKLMVEKGG